MKYRIRLIEPTLDLSSFPAWIKTDRGFEAWGTINSVAAEYIDINEAYHRAQLIVACHGIIEVQEFEE